MFDLTDHMLDAGLREDISVVFHVLARVLVSALDLESETVKVDGHSYEEVLLNVVLASDRVLVPLTLHELAANSA